MKNRMQITRDTLERAGYNNIAESLLRIEKEREQLKRMRRGRRLRRILWIIALIATLLNGYIALML